MKNKRFKKIYVEITNICNLNCSFCIPTKRKKEFMDISTFSYILDNIKPYTDYIYLHVKGEPLMHPKIEEILNIAYDKNFKVNITTNGTFLESKRHILINSKSVRQINISLHSFEKGNSDEFENYINSVILAVKEIVNKRDIYISFRLWNIADKNIDIKNNIKVLNQLEENFDNKNIAEEVLNFNKIKHKNKNFTLSKNVYLSLDDEFIWPSLNNTYENKSGYCLGLKNILGILADGTVVPCCLDNDGIINLGNIKEKSFEEIIFSKKALGIIDDFSRRIVNEPLCIHCSYKEKF